MNTILALLLFTLTLSLTTANIFSFYEKLKYKHFTKLEAFIAFEWVIVSLISNVIPILMLRHDM